MSSILHKSSKTLRKKYSICNRARHICTIVENNSLKILEPYRRLSEKVVEIGIQKLLKIPLMELRQPQTIENNNNLTFISTFNPSNP